MRDAPPAAPMSAARLATAPQRMRDAAQRFEAQALSQMLAPAFATADASRSAFGGGAAEAQWRPMLLDAITGAAVRGGHGVGIGAMVLREMMRLQETQSPPVEPTAR